MRSVDPVAVSLMILLAIFLAGGDLFMAGEKRWKMEEYYRAAIWIAVAIFMGFFSLWLGLGILLVTNRDHHPFVAVRMLELALALWFTNSAYANIANGWQDWDLKKRPYLFAACKIGCTVILVIASSFLAYGTFTRFVIAHWPKAW